MTPSIRIVGIDPGYGRVGYGIIDCVPGGDSRMVTYGCIETPAKTRLFDRLTIIHTEIARLIDKYAPTHAAVEELFFFNNAKTAIDVGQARGVIVLTLHQHKLSIDELTPLQVKQAVTGMGRAQKDQVEKMVRLTLGLKEKISPDDAADALALALAAGQRAWIKRYE